MMFWKKVGIIAAVIAATAVAPSAVIIAQNSGTGPQGKGMYGKNTAEVSDADQENCDQSVEMKKEQIQKTKTKDATEKTSPKKATTIPSPAELPDTLEGVIYHYQIPNEVVVSLRDDKGDQMQNKLYEKYKDNLALIHEENVIIKRDSVSSVKWGAGKDVYFVDFEFIPDNQLKTTFMKAYLSGARESLKRTTDISRNVPPYMIMGFGRNRERNSGDGNYILFELKNLPTMTNSADVNKRTHFDQIMKDIANQANMQMRMDQEMKSKRERIMNLDMNYESEILRLAELPKGDERSKVLKDLVVNWMLKDFENASEWIIQLPADDLDLALHSIGNSEIIEFETEAKLLDKVPNDITSSELIFFGNRWAGSDLSSAKEWLFKMQEGNKRHQVSLGIIPEWAEKEPEDAAKWVLELRSPLYQKNQHISSVARSWAAKDFEAAKEWALQIPEGEARDIALTNVVGVWGSRDPVAACNWAERYPLSPDLQEKVMKEILEREVMHAKTLFQQATLMPENMKRQIIEESPLFESTKQELLKKLENN